MINLRPAGRRRAGKRAMELIEQEFNCPCCGELITMLVDLSVESQTYTEDCEVCCRPLLIRYSAQGGMLLEFFAEPGG